MRSTEVLLSDLPHPKVELEDGRMAGELPRSKLERRSKLDVDTDP
jgi:hypothetical protein